MGALLDRRRSWMDCWVSGCCKRKPTNPYVWKLREHSDFAEALRNARLKKRHWQRSLTAQFASLCSTIYGGHVGIIRGLFNWWSRRRSAMRLRKSRSGKTASRRKSVTGKS